MFIQIFTRVQLDCKTSSFENSIKTFYNNYSPVFKAINDGFTKYNWQNDLREHLFLEIEKRVRDPAVEHHEHCGGHSETFLKTLRIFVEKYKTLDRVI